MITCAIPEPRFTQWVGCAVVVAADTFKRQVESIPNLRVQAAGAIIRPFSINPIAGEEYSPADRATDAVERRTVLGAHPER